MIIFVRRIEILFEIIAFSTYLHRISHRVCRFILFYQIRTEDIIINLGYYKT